MESTSVVAMVCMACLLIGAFLVRYGTRVGDLAFSFLGVSIVIVTIVTINVSFYAHTNNNSNSGISQVTVYGQQ